MRLSRGILLTFVAVSLVGASFAANAPPRSETRTNCDGVRDVVRHLGEEEHPERTIEALHGCGQRAVPLLIDELKVIDSESADQKSWRHAVWTERALRSITGQYFKFRTDQDLGQLAEFREKDDELGYVMEWMSHGRIYIAPKDVQAKVISAWEAWLVGNGGKFTVARFEPFGEWYW